MTISIELHLSTLSVVAFGCAFLPLAPAVLAAILSLEHYSDNDELALKVASGVEAIVLVVSAAIYMLTALNPQSLLIFANLILLILTAAAGSTWISLRMSKRDLKDVSEMQLRLEISCFITWCLAILLSTAVLSVTLTEMYLLNRVSADESSLKEKPCQAFSGSTTSTGLGLDFEPQHMQHLEHKLTVPAGVITGSAQTTDPVSPSTLGPETCTESFSSPHPTYPDLEPHDEKHVKKHKSTISLLSFLSPPQTHTKKPSITFKTQPSELLNRISNSSLKKEVTGHLKSLSSAGLGDIPFAPNHRRHKTAMCQPNTSTRSIGFDAWEVNSVAAKDRYYWSLCNIDSRGQSRNISDASYQSKISGPSSMYSRHQINSAGFTKEEVRISRQGPRARKPSIVSGRDDTPNSPEVWQDSDIVESPVEATMAQYDREQLGAQWELAAN